MREKMSKKKALTGAIIVMVIWFALWGFMFWYLSQQVDTAGTGRFVQNAMKYISENSEFADTYGKLESMGTEDTEPIANEGAEAMEYYMDFTCVTAKGEVKIRVYQTVPEDRDGDWQPRYEVLPTE